MNRAAADRLDVFLDRLDRTGLEDLEVLTLPEPDPDLRAELLDRVDEAARSAGEQRTKQVRDARLRVREILLRRFALASLPVTWVGIGWQTRPSRTEDRMRLMTAIEDAAVAAIMEDRLDRDDLAALREGFDLAASMPGTGLTGVPDLSGRRGMAAPLAAVLLAAGAGGPGLVTSIAAFLRRRRNRLDDGY
ncbi:MAG: hypothetical protein H0V73_04315 [Chloroflexi bacterium]|nr:hypothetical protein [Chloroflexota bacterium]